MPSLIISIILVVISVIVIIVSLMMSPDSNGFSGALVGSGDLELFKSSKERGVKKFMKWTMFTMGILIIILAVCVKIFTK
ncbi:preprotein translocase subunit SecG [Mycoplasma sp. ES3157-GEN-MYC]|uniref:Protein-export membrane protein SecG n=1 Tax=Mycoplasma miroungigenitalium TaxID=754515 RepID=A0A6M4JEW6_9MOLU|nr:preprotein translocase subunit SecG [Mycoplasma miroungigenitalium]MBU4690531.1 preprotein translocase subunit SecG [Mycoplasma miroungigenitalium]MBU4691798.1 preprotein translocase subunit SecG [Mycoplasma miroungigenitalium]QJR43622.1 preprotein translocase subunit SecG [Mycoplasma miroungigenitalium]